MGTRQDACSPLSAEISTCTKLSAAVGRSRGAVMDVLALSVVPIGLTAPVALSKRDQTARYCDGDCANPAATAAFSNVNEPAPSSFGLTIGLMAVRYVRPITSRRFISTVAR